MAYAATEDTWEIYKEGEHRYLVVEISETEAAAASEFSFQCPFDVATLVKYQATLTAGTGATINPKLGKVTAWTASTQNDIGTNATTAAHINDESQVTWRGPGAVFVRSQVNAGTDNSISTLIIIAEGLL